MATKICSKCKTEKPFSEFYKDKGEENGITSQCKHCYLRYQNEHVEQKSNYDKQYYKKHIKQKAKYRKDNAWRKKQQYNSNALFKKYFKQLEMFEKIRRCLKNQELLEVRCAYCGKWLLPTNRQVMARIQTFKGTLGGECRFYCSENCKIACPTYRQRKYPKGFKKATSREVVPLLRQLVLERDNYICQKCGATLETAQLHVHHEKSYTLNKIMANDPDNCITLCKECHKKVHSQNGCRYADLKC